MKTMNRRLTTVAIGLPAYNEEANIGHLLEDIYAQAEDGFIIDRVIVASDGSTDRTAEIARNSGRKTIVFDNPTRQGVAVRQNQILEYAEADILVILNADIRLFDRAFLRKIIEPVIREQADLSSGNYSAITPRTWVGQALAVGLEMKNQVYAAYRQGDNFYTCHGTARAFSRRLYKRLRFKESIGEDAYSYFYVKSRGFKYAFAPAAVLHIYLPENRRDYLRQTVRFIKTPARAGRDFSPDLVASELKLPRLLLARSLARSLGRNPFYTLVFLFLYGWARLSARCERPGSPDWEIASSTKKPRGGPPADGIVFGLRLALFFRNLGYRLIRLLNEMKLEVYPRLFILCYHSVSAGGWRYSVNPDEFKRQIDWLLANFAPLSLSRAAAFLAGGRLPEKNSFVLTFDDGYADNSDIAEFLHGRGITPAIFLLASPEAADRHELSTEQGLLDWASAGKLAVQGWEIGCHSATHANFASLDEAELKKEIMGAKKQLEKRLGTRIDYFSYPKGEYNEVARSIVSEAGYKLAVTMDDHIISRNSDRLAWPRIGVDGTHGFKDFKILFSRTAIHFRQVVKTAVKYKARFASYWRHKTEKKDRTPACRENFGIWQKLLLFFVNRLVTEDKIKRAALPDALKGYRLRSIIDRPKGDNQYQFGIYENENGAKGILKMWDGTRRDGDWFWLANEIRTYEGLADLSRACGSALEEKFPRIKLPRFISSFNTND
ncbi:MAG: polysaccharide deacetylase family protein, partial [Planctomycetes bacterium]|nr:polysaccharide deacetylase family protein [Planctomycetota bacterium]